ncbi:hypothetical protein [Actinopolyspora erythraea]|uniref:hypothetical protein n=1 Tax=Actinopolyspora erythraea TaxID=414996 RepID=UPI0011846BED|nr:hypothetical protein [Actinopolyspora erythraea]
MSLPGGPNNWTGSDGGAPRYYDPLTGQPVAQEGTHTPEHSQYGTSFGPPRPAPAQYGAPRWDAAPRDPSSAPGRSRGPTIAVVSTAVASVVIIITTLVLVNIGDEPGGGDGSGFAAEGSATATGSRPPVTAEVPGWQSVPVWETGIAYDVPSDWTTYPAATETLVANGANDEVTLSGYSMYMEGFCDQAQQSFRALIGLTSANEPDNAEAGRRLVEKLGTMLWTTSDGVSPRVRLGEPRPATLDGGKLEATFVSAEVVPAATDTCNTESAYIGVMALPHQEGTAMLVGVADQRFDQAVSPSRMERSLRSLRLLPR